LVRVPGALLEVLCERDLVSIRDANLVSFFFWEFYRLLAVLLYFS